MCCKTGLALYGWCRTACALLSDAVHGRLAEPYCMSYLLPTGTATLHKLITTETTITLARLCQDYGVEDQMKDNLTKNTSLYTTISTWLFMLKDMLLVI